MFKIPRKFVAATSMVALAAACVATQVMASPALSWSLSRDVMQHMSATNPNGVWTYMAAPMSTLHNQITYSKLTQFSPFCAGVAQMRCWLPATGPEPAVYVSDIDQSFYSLNADAGVPFVHPSQTDAAVVRWLSPVTGSIKVLGRFSALTSQIYCGDGVRWSIDKGNNTLASGALNYTSTPDGKVFSLTTNVNVGQALNFIVDSGANANSQCDGTEIEVLITKQE